MDYSIIKNKNTLTCIVFILFFGLSGCSKFLKIEKINDKIDVFLNGRKIENLNISPTTLSERINRNDSISLKHYYFNIHTDSFTIRIYTEEKLFPKIGSYPADFKNNYKFKIYYGNPPISSFYKYYDGEIRIDNIDDDTYSNVIVISGSLDLVAVVIEDHFNEPYRKYIIDTLRIQADRFRVHAIKSHGFYE